MQDILISQLRLPIMCQMKICDKIFVSIEAARNMYEKLGFSLTGERYGTKLSWKNDYDTSMDLHDPYGGQ